MGTVERIAKRIVESANGMTVDDLVAALDGAISSIFPVSHVSVSFADRIAPSIHIVFAFGTDWPHGIIENDRAFHSIMISLGRPGTVAADSPAPSRVQVGLLTGGTVYGPNVSNRVKVGWRNRTGTPEQVVRHIAAYFTKLKTAVENHPDAGRWGDGVADSA